MTILKQNRISMIAGIAILTIALAFGGFSFASHSFEAGVAEGTIPDNTHIRLDGMTLPAAGVFPLYDASPNYVSGHFLLTSPCEPVSEGDDTYQPTQSPNGNAVFDLPIPGTHGSLLFNQNIVINGIDTTPPTLSLTALNDNPSAPPVTVTSVTNGIDGFSELDGAITVTTVTIDESTFALVASVIDDSVQIINITNPNNPTPVATVTDSNDEGGFNTLSIPIEIATATIDASTFALVASFADNGVQIIDITNIIFAGSSSVTGNITVDVTFSENINSTTVSVNDFTVAGTTVTGVSTNNNTATLTVSPALAGNATPQVTLTNNDSSISDISGNAAAAPVSVTATDGVSPTFTAVSVNSTSTAVVFSEAVDGTLIFSNWSIGGQTPTLANGTINDGAILSDVTSLVFTHGTITDMTPDVTYTAGDIADNTSNSVATATVTATDALPTFSSATFNEGTRVLSITFSETIDTNDNSDISLSGLTIRESGFSTGGVSLVGNA